VNYVARWNGAGWSPLGTGLDFYCYALASFGSRLVAGGYFTTAGGTTARGIARWNGTTWSALGGGVVGFVSCLETYDGALHIGGEFDEAGGVPANNVARWTGATWQGLGDGVESDVFALETRGASLFVGGSFLTAGLKASHRVARWDGIVVDAGEPPAPGRLELAAAEPNPFGSRALLTYTLSQAGRARLTVHDVRGRHVAVLADGFAAAGPHRVAWDGRDGQGVAVPPGVYFARLQTEMGLRTRPLVRVAP
jgi:hypothetical protein